MSYDVLDVRPLTKRIGAEIFNVDLTKTLKNKELEEIHTALMEHQVIFFRDQNIDHESHKRLGRAFGELVQHSGVAGLPDEPDIVRIHGDHNSVAVAGEDWHSDMSFDEKPPMGSILHIHTLPESGGDTLFASAYAAYNGLSEPMKAFLAPLTAVHDGNHVFGIIADEDTTYQRKANRFATTRHPIIRTHPVTKRKLLFVNQLYTTKIPELSDKESAGVLKVLFDHINDPNFHVRFRWRPNSIAFWDNRCTQHFAVWDYFPETRSGFRVTIAGDKVY